MDVRSCRNCGNLFNYVTGPNICPSCRESLEAKFVEVKAFIEDNPGVGMKQVSEACDIDMSVIQQWLREERLEVTQNSAIFLSCDGCGANIRSGRFCEKCKLNLSNGFRAAIRHNRPEPEIPEPKKNVNKMRFLDS